MRPRAVSWGVLAVVGASAWIGLAAPVAHADAPVEQGWWTVANPGSPASAPAPPDVPADGLLVQGGPDGSPVALAALVYESAAGASAQRLVLKVAAGSGTTPQASLQLCPLNSTGLVGEQGGPIADAPEYDCARKVTAVPGADGTTYTFTLSALAASGPVAVAVLPTAATDRVVLAKPGSDSLVTSGSTQTPAPVPFLPAAGLASAPVPAVGLPVSGLPAVGAGQLPGIAAPASTAPEPPVVAEVPVGSKALPSVVPAAAATATGRADHAAGGVLLLAMLAAGCGLWAFAGHRPLGVDGEPDSLG